MWRVGALRRHHDYAEQLRNMRGVRPGHPHTASSHLDPSTGAPWFADRSPWQDRYKSLDDSMSMRSPLQVAPPPSESPLHAFLTCASPAIGATVRGVRQPTLLRWILPWRRGLQRDGMACRGRTERPCGSSSRKGYRSPPTHGPARSTTGTSALGVTWASTSRRRTRKGCAQPAQRRDAYITRAPIVRVTTPPSHSHPEDPCARSPTLTPTLTPTRTHARPCRRVQGRLLPYGVRRVEVSWRLLEHAHPAC